MRLSAAELKRRKNLSRAIELAYDSLKSHLSPSYTPEKKPCCQKNTGSLKFHTDCIKEYAEIIKLIADSL